MYMSDTLNLFKNIYIVIYIRILRINSAFGEITQTLFYFFRRFTILLMTIQINTNVNFQIGANRRGCEFPNGVKKKNIYIYIYYIYIYIIPKGVNIFSIISCTNRIFVPGGVLIIVSLIVGMYTELGIMFL